jgi:hypothetical protein
MLGKLSIIFTFALFVSFIGTAEAKPFVPFSKDYSHTLCKQKGFHCVVIERSVPWKKFWPDDREREIIMKLNRLNRKFLVGSMTVAIPDDMSGKSLADWSPFAATMKSLGEKVVVFDPALLAWGAYDEYGKLVKWGPALGGRDYCPDIKRACRTPEGEDFHVTFKGGPNSRSPAYPIGCKGKTCAPMPYVMYFLKLYYGIHGSEQMIGWNASHGCIRTFTDDAKWLSKNFVKVGTRVIVRPYPAPLPIPKKKKR